MVGITGVLGSFVVEVDSARYHGVVLDKREAFILSSLAALKIGLKT